jgi:PAS domain-containing protein
VQATSQNVEGVSCSEGELFRNLMLEHNHLELAGADYVVFVDTSRRYLDCSAGVSRLLGWSRAELLKKTIDDISFHPGEVPNLFGAYQRRGKMDGEYVLRNKERMPIPIRYRAYVFFDGCNAAVWEPITDWRQVYLAALMEVDPRKLRSKIDIALAAVYQQMGKAGNGNNEEQQMLRDALFALQALQRDLR